MEDYFIINKQEKGKYSLNLSNLTKPIVVKIPFLLNEDAAILAGLMPDGSLIKDLMRVYFHQKKDLSKIELFDKTIKKLFSKDIILFRRIDNRGATQIYINSRTLANFFYYILQIPKSDEEMRVPNWILKSLKKVKIAYIREAFDMEGTILKKLTEIRFVSKHKKFAMNLKKLLSTLCIESHLTFTPRPSQSSGQYRVSIYKKENFKRFKEIGFRIPFLKNRFLQLSNKYGI